MNLSLSDFNLIIGFCNKYNLRHYNQSGRNVDYRAWASSIRYLYKQPSPIERRAYIKCYKYSSNKKYHRSDMFRSTMDRIFMRNGRCTANIADIRKIERAIKIKYEFDHCHHDCYSYLRGLVRRVCACCGSTFYCEEFEIGRDGQSHSCSKECASVLRVFNKLKLYRFRGYNALQRYLSFMISQSQKKRAKRSKGNFKWS